MTRPQRILVPFFLCVFCSLPSIPAICEPESVPVAAPRFPWTGLVTGSGVNLRSGPGRSYEILLQLARGSKLRVLERRLSWVGVSLPETVPAYLHRSYVGEPEQDWAPVKGEHVQVRVRPSDSSTSWGEISSPERVRVLGTYGEWVRVLPPSFCRGWVSAEYVVFLQQEEETVKGGLS